MDGWNEEQLGGVLSVLDDLYEISYELKNCVRGCYTGAHTYEELQSYIKRKAQQLVDEAEWMDTTEEEYEEEEEE